jgi:hypothetical protein
MEERRRTMLQNCLLYEMGKLNKKVPLFIMTGGEQGRDAHGWN